MPGALRRALRRPARTLLKFEPTSEDQWGSADHKHAFTITREFDAGASTSFFVVHVSQLDGSYRRRTGRSFETFDAAVHRCSIHTREARRQVAYHEAGHAVTAYLLGFTGVWVEMDNGYNHAITRHDMLPSILTVADPGPGTVSVSSGRAVLARYQYEELMYFVAGKVAEEKIAGYPGDHAEEDTAGRPRIEWDAIRVARTEAGLPICGHKDCTIPFDAGCDAGHVAEVIRRAEDEVFALLKANWPTVLRVVNALCKQDRITSIEFDALMAGPKRAGKHRRRPKKKPAAQSGKVRNDRPSIGAAPLKYEFDRRGSGGYGRQQLSRLLSSGTIGTGSSRVEPRSVSSGTGRGFSKSRVLSGWFRIRKMEEARP